MMTGGGVPSSAGGSPRFLTALPTTTRRRAVEPTVAETDADQCKRPNESSEDDSDEESPATHSAAAPSEHHAAAATGRYQRKKMQWMPESWAAKAEGMAWCTVTIVGCFMTSGKNLSRRVIAALIVMVALSLFLKVSVIDSRNQLQEVKSMVTSISERVFEHLKRTWVEKVI